MLGLLNNAHLRAVIYVCLLAYCEKCMINPIFISFTTKEYLLMMSAVLNLNMM